MKELDAGMETNERVLGGRARGGRWRAGGGHGETESVKRRKRWALAGGRGEFDGHLEVVQMSSVTGDMCVEWDA